MTKTDYQFSWQRHRLGNSARLEVVVEKWRKWVSVDVQTLPEKRRRIR